jgi:hypothetical protein
MDSATDLYALVFGERRPDLKLISDGALDPEWCRDYEDLLDSALESNLGATWPRTLLQAAHFVSFYLPLRAKVAFATEKADESLKQRVWKLHVSTETKLFANMVAAANSDILRSLEAEHSLDEPSLEMVRLCFGKGNPAVGARDESTVVAWAAGTRATWSLLNPTFAATGAWDKWTAMAARLASFYWDLLLRQTILLPENAMSKIPTLDSCLPASTRSVIHVMLYPNASELDETGLPLVGAPSPLAEYSMRRAIEPILMIRV